MTAGQAVRVRFVRLGKREHVEVQAVLAPRESVAELVCRLAHEQAPELKGVALRVLVTAPPAPVRGSAQYAYVEAAMPKGGKSLQTRVGHGMVWVGEQ